MIIWTIKLRVSIATNLIRPINKVPEIEKLWRYRKLQLQSSCILSKIFVKYLQLNDFQLFLADLTRFILNVSN